MMSIKTSTSTGGIIISVTDILFTSLKEIRIFTVSSMYIVIAGVKYQIPTCGPRKDTVVDPPESS